LIEGRKEPIAALVMSLIPGLGHMYCGFVTNGIVWLVVTWMAYNFNSALGLFVHMFCAASAVNAAGRANAAEARELHARKDSAEEVARLLDRAAQDRRTAGGGSAPTSVQDVPDPAPRALRAAFPMPPVALLRALQDGARELGMRVVASDTGKGLLLLEDRIAGGAVVPIEARVEATPTGSRARLMVDRPPGALDDPAADDHRLRELLTTVERALPGGALREVATPFTPVSNAAAPATGLSEEEFLDRLAAAWDAYEEEQIDATEWARRRDALLRSVAGGDAAHQARMQAACAPLVHAGILTGRDLNLLR
jgi:hypothetical protein